MKPFLIITAIIAVMAIASCKKEDGLIIPPDPVNTWEYNTTKIKATYCDVIGMKGLTLIFYPDPATGATQTLTFIFPLRPVENKTYTPANDTNSTSVKLHLETGNGNNYNSSGNDTARVRATIATNGKITLIGDNIRMQRDTAPGTLDSLKLSFNLTEF